MAKKLVGSFYFKQTINGNLIGEFANNIKKIIYTESCNILNHDKIDAKFIGIYHSTWLEDEKVCDAELEIEYKWNNKIEIFKLEWRNNREILFSGEGMLCDEVLIGNYKIGK